jgi:hypothetical protein
MPEKMARPLALLITSVGILALSMVALARARRGPGLLQDGIINTGKAFEDLSCFIALLAETCCSKESHSENDPFDEMLLIAR